MKQTLTIIDGNSLLFRAFYGVHGRLTKKDGTPVNAVYGVCNMLLPILAAAKSEDVFICAFDAARKNWRNDIYPEYKANRANTPADLLSQIELTRGAVRSFGIPCMVVDGVEADDVIATLAAHECATGKQTRIISSDKDLMQLVSDCCYMFDTMKNQEIRTPQVIEKFGVRPDQVIDAQSLMGDSSDNVPGVPGIGPKKAAELINQFGNIDNLYANLDQVANERIRNLLIDNRDQAFVSRELVTLKSDVELPEFSYAPFKFNLNAALDFAENQIESPAIVSKIKKLFLNRDACDNPIIEPVDIKTEPVCQVMNPPEICGYIPPVGFKNAVVDIITTEEELDKFIATVKDILVIDTETTGLNQMSDKMVGISMATSDKGGVYVPMRHISAPTDLLSEKTSNVQQLSIDIVKKKLWPVFLNPDVVKVGHNLKYDLHIMENDGWDTNQIAPIDDTMLLSYVLHGTAHAHNLDELAKIYLGHENIKFDSLFPPKTKNSDKNFARLSIEAAAPYAAEDSYVCFALYKTFREKLNATRDVSNSACAEEYTLYSLYENCDRPLLRILLNMERTGVLVDRQGLQNLSRIFHSKLRELEKQIFEMAGREFNIASPLQLGVVLFDELGLIPENKKRSTDASVLNYLLDSHPVISKILEWRSLAKLAGTYADALPHQIGKDGRIHTTYLQTSTNTARLSSRDPNLQNIPIKTELGAEIRKCFIAPAGRVLIAADYSQIQLRLLADMANVPALKESFATGADIHDMTARKIFGIERGAPVPKDLRRAAKTINFSIIYGVSQFGLSDQLKTSPAEAKKIIDNYMAGFPEINSYMKNVQEFVVEHAYVYTPWGRRIEIPEVRIPRLRSYALRAAINAPIQGFEADLMRRAMVLLSQISPADFGIDLAGKNLNTTAVDLFSTRCVKDSVVAPEMIMQVHDEIVFECDESNADIVAKKIKSVMESVVKLSVPLIAEYSINTKWDK